MKLINIIFEKKRRQNESDNTIFLSNWDNILLVYA